MCQVHPSVYLSSTLMISTKTCAKCVCKSGKGGCENFKRSTVMESALVHALSNEINN